MLYFNILIVFLSFLFWPGHPEHERIMTTVLAILVLDFTLNGNGFIFIVNHLMNYWFLIRCVAYFIKDLLSIK